MRKLLTTRPIACHIFAVVQLVFTHAQRRRQRLQDAIEVRQKPPPQCMELAVFVDCNVRKMYQLSRAT
jgi:hypothetical protein